MVEVVLVEEYRRRFGGGDGFGGSRNVMVKVFEWWSK